MLQEVIETIRFAYLSITVEAFEAQATMFGLC
jgi:hypothetical protein